MTLRLVIEWRTGSYKIKVYVLYELAVSGVVDRNTVCEVMKCELRLTDDGRLKES